MFSKISVYIAFSFVCKWLSSGKEKCFFGSCNEFTERAVEVGLQIRT